MKRKPWPLIVISLLYILSPIGNIISNSFVSQVDVMTYINALFSPEELLRTTIFFAIPIFSGVLVYICKKWSYYLFMVLMVVPFVYSYSSWQVQPTAQVGFFLLAFYLVNLLVVGYFVLPQVRQVYFDSNLRWWETKPRYNAEFTSQLEWLDQKGIGEIKNISEGGVFIQTELKVNPSGRVRIMFEYNKVNYELVGEVVFSRRFNNLNGYGVSLFINEEQTNSLRVLIRSLSEEGALVTGRAPTDEDTFGHWIKRLVSQKRGWVPEAERHQAKSREPQKDAS